MTNVTSMIDFLTVDDKNLTRGMQLLRDEIAKRGWSAQVPYVGSSHCFINRGDGKPLHIFNSTPPTTSFASAHLANDKYATYQLLRETGTHQPETVIVNELNDMTAAYQLLTTVGKVVVKPIDGGHGEGITVGVTDTAVLERAVEYARKFNKNSKCVIVQQHFPHEAMYDLRLVCIEGKFIGAIWRVPARVYGDGRSTVRELVEKENQSPHRGVPYHAPLATIDSIRAAEFLGDVYESVPDKDEEVQVLGVANYGAGGELIDVTDDIPDWMANEAERVSMVADLHVCGVDYAVSSIPRADLEDSQLNAAILEINKCPSLAIHDMPTSGKPRGATAAYVSYLARIPSGS